MMHRFTRAVAAFSLAAATMATASLAQAADKFIVVQSTTSTQNSGLFDYLLPKFTAETGIQVRVVAVGTGQAIKNSMNCDGDVLLAHAKSAEEKFVAEGYGVKRTDVMYNDFVIVGPNSDPAGIAGSKDVVKAMATIAQKGALFASRGDDSGTYKKEMEVWQAANVDVKAASGKWYRETGSGMGATLNTGVGMGAYILADRASWLAFGNKAGYKIVVEGDPVLFNQYGVTVVNPAKCPNVKTDYANAFANWLLSAKGQSTITGFQLNGQPMFFPNAPKAKG
ncbi:substrate-binding domain-containing protein [Limnobacter humi]|uniref:Substrate-binding domain-containing protein n=1 Tax=Limnobacter humi TaxID=1778671 RepID=A0ABT1WJV2_9BURK|nr:substrate-binding domain-containing protein [Limnobacter humi]MCQ8897797.1 substrate-binding domain-containing protein [Limnobacter humi]